MSIAIAILYEKGSRGYSHSENLSTSFTLCGADKGSGLVILCQWPCPVNPIFSEQGC